MHTCTSCAQNALMGGEAANICTNCSAVTVEAGSSPVVMIAIFAVGTAILALQATKLVRGFRAPRVAAA